MGARLIFLTGSRAGTAFDLTEDTMTFGRASRNTITFAAHEVLVSSNHASLQYQEGRYVLRDQGSRNGTFVNAKRVVEQTLEDGDLIQFGAGGPGARFVLHAGAGVMPTLDPSETARASQLLALTRSSASPREPELSTSRMRTTREMLAVAVGRVRRTRRILVAMAMLGVAGIAAVGIWQEHSKSALAASLSELSRLLGTERDSRAALERDLAVVRSRYDSLRGVVQAGQERLASDPRIDPNRIREYSQGVALVVFVYGYVEQGGTEFLRYSADSRGDVNVAPSGLGAATPQVRFGGSGPPIRRQGTATAFLVDAAGYLLTNRHVAEPWVEDKELEFMRSRGIEATGRFLTLEAFFPHGKRPFSLAVDSVSDIADIAVMHILGPAPNAPVLPLATAGEAPRPGDPLVFIGYPTGVHNLLFRVNDDERADILRTAGDDSRKLAEELAARELIQPLITNGSVSDTTGTEVIHTAATTVGGSGGPLIDLRQHVVAVHYASVNSPAPGDPFRTQRGVPIRFAWSILPAMVRRDQTRD
ncbi:MAG: FHA domain-containing protein [Gemmatimonadales bacterium]